MKTLSRTFFNRVALISILTDLSALAFIYFVPTISHMLSFPVYLVEPMRILLILAMVHTNKRNAYIIALTLPLFSLVISGHPFFPKMLLIATELTLNVFIFYALIRRVKYYFPAILASIVLSKLVYYLLKFILIRFAIIQTELISTPLLIQLATTVVLSLYLFAFYKRESRQD